MIWPRLHRCFSCGLVCLMSRSGGTRSHLGYLSPPCLQLCPHALPLASWQWRHECATCSDLISVTTGYWALPFIACYRLTDVCRWFPAHRQSFPPSALSRGLPLDHVRCDSGRGPRCMEHCEAALHSCLHVLKALCTHTSGRIDFFSVNPSNSCYSSNYLFVTHFQSPNVKTVENLFFMMHFL